MGPFDPTARPRPGRGTQLQLEELEDRLTPSWATIPPTLLTPSPAAVGVKLDGFGRGSGTAAIAGREVDWYRLRAPVAGTYVFQATTPGSSLDTVLGLYSSAG